MVHNWVRNRQPVPADPLECCRSQRARSTITTGKQPCLRRNPADHTTRDPGEKLSNALDPWPTENGRPISTAPFFAFATTQRSAIRKIKKVVPGHVSTVWSPLIRLESARAVRTVTERSILRVPATAQGNGRLVGAQGISVTCRIGQLDRSLHKQRAIGSHPNFYVGHESLLFFRWIFPASHPNQDRYPQLHSC